MFERYIKRVKVETDNEEDYNYMARNQTTVSAQNSEEMPRKCFVPLCKSGYSSCDTKHILFNVPRDEKLRKEWVQAIQRVDRDLTEKDVVCEEHFEETDLVRGWQSGGITVTYKRPRLSGTAVPSRFFYLNENGTVKKPYRKSGKILDKSCIEMINEIEKSSKILDKSCDELQSVETEKSDKKMSSNFIEVRNEEIQIFNKGSVAIEREETEKSVKVMVKSRVEVRKEESEEGMIKQTLFDSIWNEEIKLTLPTRSWAPHFVEQNGDKYIVITEMSLDTNKNLNLVRKLIINARDSTIMTCVNTKEIQLDLLKIRDSTIFPVRSVKALEIILKSFHELSVCAGGPPIMLNPDLDFSTDVAIVELNGLWRHVDCKLVKRSDENHCIMCAKLFDAFLVNHREC